MSYTNCKVKTTAKIYPAPKPKRTTVKHLQAEIALLKGEIEQLKIFGESRRERLVEVQAKVNAIYSAARNGNTFGARTKALEAIIRLCE